MLYSDSGNVNYILQSTLFPLRPRYHIYGQVELFSLKSPMTAKRLDLMTAQPYDAKLDES